jgi:hypothetical protein
MSNRIFQAFAPAAVGLWLAGCSGGDGGGEDTIPDREEEELSLPDAEIDTSVEPPLDPPADPPVEQPVDPSEDLPADEGPIEPYGMLNADFSTPFILDGEVFMDPELGPSYTADHPEGLMERDSFTGTYGSGMLVPSLEAVVTGSFALHFMSEEPDAPPPLVVIFQDSCTDEFCTSAANPLVRMFIPTNDIVPGIATVDVAAETDLMLILLNSNGLTGCVLAVGIGGTINVTEATGTTQQDGGTLAFNGSDIPMYHPTITPHGDLSGMFAMEGLPACPME